MREINVEIPQELIDKFDVLPDKKKEWTDEEDALLLKYWPIKIHSAVARLLGRPRSTTGDRYEYLTQE